MVASFRGSPMIRSMATLWNSRVSGCVSMWYIGGFFLMHEDLVLLAYSAPFYIVCNSFLYFWPPVFFLHPLECLIPAWVFCYRVVVHKGHDGPFHL